tara:strand:- start:26 stop:460 length:435 start_codon:yes stop_codon:yes gene_type:complete
MGIIDSPFDVGNRPIEAHEYNEVITEKVRERLEELGMRDVSLDARAWAEQQANEGWELFYSNMDMSNRVGGGVNTQVYEAADNAVPDYYDARWELFVGLRAYKYIEVDENSSIDISMNARCGDTLSGIAISLIHLGYGMAQAQE